MARALQKRLFDLLGDRKVRKYFPGEANPCAGDEDILDEFVLMGLRELGNTVPFFADESLSVHSSGAYVDLAPFGETAVRRLDVDSVYDDSGSYPVKIPESIISYADGRGIKKSGWFVDDSKLWFHSISPASGYRVKFMVVPLESEIEEVPHYMRAASLFAAANGIEEILSRSVRETNIVLEGVPNIKATTSESSRFVGELRLRARRILGFHAEVD